MSYRTLLSGQMYSFESVKEVLAKANEEKSGDILAGIAAGSDMERIAAKAQELEVQMDEIRRQAAALEEQAAACDRFSRHSLGLMRCDTPEMVRYSVT